MLKIIHLNPFLPESGFCSKKSVFRPDLKICWFAVTWVCFFKYTLPVRKKNYHFEMEKIALILIYKNFVSKKIFFRLMNIKKKIDLHFSCGPGWVTANQHIFKSGLTSSLVLISNRFSKLFL